MIALLPATAFADEGKLWVANKNMTITHTISGDTGTATFDPSTNTLTLDNFSYTGEGYTFVSTNDKSAAIYSTLDTLNVTVNGNNSLTNTATDKESYGIYAENQLVITKDSTGTIVAKATGNNRNVGVYVSGGSITVEKGTLIGEGGNTDPGSLSTGVWCLSGNIIVEENAQLKGIGGTADISRGICVSNKLVVNGGTVEGVGGETKTGDQISHGISAGTIESTSEKSNIIGKAGTSTGESAGIYIWNSATFSKGHMKGIGGSNSTDESYGIYVNGDDKLTVIGGTVTAQGKTRNVVYLNDGGEGEAIPAPDSSPDTGDNSNMILWLVLLLVSGGAIIVAVVLGRKRK